MADLLPLNPDELLSTTRAVRKRLDLDRPVVDKVLAREKQIRRSGPIAETVLKLRQ